MENYRVSLEVKNVWFGLQQNQNSPGHFLNKWKWTLFCAQNVSEKFKPESVQHSIRKLAPVYIYIYIIGIGGIYFQWSLNWIEDDLILVSVFMSYSFTCISD